MIRQKLTVAVMASALAIGTAPAWAGQRSSNGDSVGTAVPRDSGGSSSSSPSGGGSSGSGSSGSGSNSGFMPSAPPSERASAPNAERAESQRRGGGASSGRAVPRGSSGSGGGTSSTAGSGRDGRNDGGTVDSGGRSREGRPVQGTAVDRRGPLPGRGGGGSAYYPGVIYDPYYSYVYDPYYNSRSSSYWSPYGYGYGLGYFAYDPYLFSGYGGPYGGYGGAYGGSDPYQGSYGGSYRGAGSMRLKVKPADAQVYVDGYFVGTVDSFDGAFQRLAIEEGAHKVEVRAEGFETVQFDVMIIPGETVTYKGELKRGR